MFRYINAINRSPEGAAVPRSQAEAARSVTPDSAASLVAFQPNSAQAACKPGERLTVNSVSFMHANVACCGSICQQHAVVIPKYAAGVEESLSDKVGDRIRARRVAAGISVAELARRVVVTEGAIRQIEKNDTKRPSFTLTLKIADALGASPWALADLPEPAKRPGDAFSDSPEDQSRSDQEILKGMAASLQALQNKVAEIDRRTSPQVVEKRRRAHDG